MPNSFYSGALPLRHTRHRYAIRDGGGIRTLDPRIIIQKKVSLTSCLLCIILYHGYIKVSRKNAFLFSLTSQKNNVIISYMKYI